MFPRKDQDNVSKADNLGQRVSRAAGIRAASLLDYYWKNYLDY